MKICFLDFDGVINCLLFHGGPGEFSKAACANVQTMLTKIPDLRIVISSSWRIHGLQACRDILKSNGIDPTKVIGITDRPVEDHGKKYEREEYVECWLEDHPEIDNFVILDDYAKFPKFQDHFVKTNAYVGFTQKDMERAIEILESESKLH